MDMEDCIQTTISLPLLNHYDNSTHRRTVEAYFMDYVTDFAEPVLDIWSYVRQLNEQSVVADSIPCRIFPSF